MRQEETVVVSCGEPDEFGKTERTQFASPDGGHDSVLMPDDAAWDFAPPGRPWREGGTDVEP